MLLDLEPYGVNSYPDFQLQMTLFSCADSILFKYSILSFARNKDSFITSFRANLFNGSLKTFQQLLFLECQFENWKYYRLMLQLIEI